MREEVEEPNWFARWEDELPTPEELTPLSQSLITPDLALAFDIPTPTTTTTTTTTNNNNNNNNNSTTHPPPLSSLHVNHHLGHLNHHLPPPPTHQSPDFDSADLASSGGGSGNNGGGDEPARTLKRPRLVWTPQLHKRFVDAVAHLGIKNAVPKTIMQLMSVDGLTRENVASHLQKYRLYLKRMQGLTSGGGGSGGPISAADAATDQLFATGPLPHHFLGRTGVGGGPAGGGAAEPTSFLPYMPVAALQHHQQMAVAAAAAAAQQQQQQQYYNHRQLGGHFVGEHGLFARGAPGLQVPPGLGRAGPGLHSIMQQQQQQQMGTVGDLDDLEEGGRGGGRKVLTLFPTGED